LYNLHIIEHIRISPRTN